MPTPEHSLLPRAIPLLLSESVRLNILLLTGFTLLFSLGYLGLSSKWWFEDDPVQIHYVGQIKNPVSIFADPDVIRGYGAGKALAPMQLLSYWFDVRLFGPFPAIAYAHNLAALVLTALMIQLTLRRWTGDFHISTVAALTWLLLPTTIAVHYYISARHYMEGLLCTLLVVYCTEKFLQPSWRFSKTLALTGLVVFAVAGMLSKEIYAAIIPAYLLAIGLHKRKAGLASLPLVLGCGYLLYRLLIHGTGLDYTMPFLGVYDYLRFVFALPYTVSANVGGYVLVACLVALLIKLWKSPAMLPHGKTSAKLALVLLGAALVATYPVSYAVLTGYKIPDTSYRMPFILNTILVMWAAYAMSRFLTRKQQLLSFVLLLIVLLPGSERTRRLWQERMARAEIEGRFYVNNPDKLMYSEEEAFWFIIGVHRLHNVTTEHYINKQFRVGKVESERLRQHSEIWRYHEGSFQPDAALFEELKKENRHIELER
jgi:hypothetical protein